jgi:ATP-binding cassette subfamily B protein
VLSRVTNDIDNIANTLQQTLTQLITSVLTVIGVLAMMFWISPLLAVISLLMVPLSFVVTLILSTGFGVAYDRDLLPFRRFLLAHLCRK